MRTNYGVVARRKGRGSFGHQEWTEEVLQDRKKS